MTLLLIILALGTSLHCMKMHHISRQLDNLCIEFCWRQRIVKHHLWTGLSVEFLGSVIKEILCPKKGFSIHQWEILVFIVKSECWNKWKWMSFECLLVFLEQDEVAWGKRCGRGWEVRALASARPRSCEVQDMCTYVLGHQKYKICIYVLGHAKCKICTS